MDIHHVLTHTALELDQHRFTAFSALPNAPVQQDRPTRRQRLVAAWRRRRPAAVAPQPLPRPTLVGKVAAEPAEACRMVA